MKQHALSLVCRYTPVLAASIFVRTGKQKGARAKAIMPLVLRVAAAATVFANPG
jgi:hypothetical protein